MTTDAAVPGIRPARVDIAPEVIEDVHDRLRRTRWFDGIEGSGWEYGTDVACLRELCGCWATEFDGYAVQDRFNRFERWRSRSMASDPRVPPEIAASGCDPAAAHPRVARLGHRVHRRHRSPERSLRSRGPGRPGLPRGLPVHHGIRVEPVRGLGQRAPGVLAYVLRI